LTEPNSKGFMDAILEFIDGLERTARVVEYFSRSIGEVARSIQGMAKQGVSGTDTGRTAVRGPGDETGDPIATGAVEDGGETDHDRDDRDSEQQSSADLVVGL